MAAALVHTTAYQFQDCSERESLRQHLRENGEGLELLGNITLAPEGINLSLSGADDSIKRMEQILLQESPFQKLQFRRSPVSAHPYSKLIVRCRPALLPVSMDAPDSRHPPGEHLAPEILQQWLEEDRPLRLLDVRNLYETHLGRFENAEVLPLQQFRDFPNVAQKLRPDERPLVTYCTGGIRCELASAWLLGQGHRDVWQLSGGILHYLEQCGSQHWQGECFVFDDRLAVDARLQATYPTLCRTCQKPLTEMRLGRCAQCGDPRLESD